MRVASNGGDARATPSILRRLLYALRPPMVQYADILETENEVLRNACEQAHLLLGRNRFSDDSEAKLVRVVLNNALTRIDYR